MTFILYRDEKQKIEFRFQPVFSFLNNKSSTLTTWLRWWRPKKVCNSIFWGIRNFLRSHSDKHAQTKV